MDITLKNIGDLKVKFVEYATENLGFPVDLYKNSC